MVDPTNVRNFNRSTVELEEFAIFCVCVAGKRADVTAKRVHFIAHYAKRNERTPFTQIRMWQDRGELRSWLEFCKLGQYTRLTKTLLALSGLNLRTAHLSELEAVMGPKSARFFLINTRPNQRLAALDTHILAELAEFYGDNIFPKSTPPKGPTYRAIEDSYLFMCDELGKDPAEYDLEIWNRRSQASRKVNVS